MTQLSLQDRIDAYNAAIIHDYLTRPDDILDGEIVDEYGSDYKDQVSFVTCTEDMVIL